MSFELQQLPAVGWINSRPLNITRTRRACSVVKSIPMRTTEHLLQLQAVLIKYGWSEDESGSNGKNHIYFPPNGLTNVKAISLEWERRGGFWYWTTLDWQSSDVTKFRPEELEEHLRLRQPDLS
jgi:hypothetical protein